MDSVSPDPDRPIPTLRVLEPSPDEETAPGTNGSEYFPQTAQSSFLGLSSHSLSYYRTHARPPVQTMQSLCPLRSLTLTAVLRAQKYSSITFTLFTAMHFTNTSLIPLLTPSLPAANSYLLLTRPYYQSALAEPLLVGIPLATHIASGIALRLHRRNIHTARYAGDAAPASSAAAKKQASASLASAWPPLSWTSLLGYAAIPLVYGHAALTRGLPLLVEGSSAGIGLDYVGHGVALEPAVGFAGYVALVGVVGAHVVWGLARWLEVTPAYVRDVLGKKRRWWALQGVGAGVVLAWWAGGVGVVCRGGRVGGWVGRGYDELFRRVPVLGRAVG